MRPFGSLSLLLLVLCGCGYRNDGGEKITVSVPYVVGDFEGELTEAIIAALSQTASFRYTMGTGDWTLKVKITDSKNDRIGFRRDENDKSSSQNEDNKKSRNKNLVGCENRKSISAEVSVINSTTCKPILGPQTIKAFSDFDYIDPNSTEDVFFTDPSTGLLTTSIAFSLGQLDSVGSAGQEAGYPIYKRLAQIIVDGMIASGNE